MDKPIAEVKANAFAAGIKPENGLQVLFLYMYNSANTNYYIDCIKKGVILVSHVSLKDENGNPYPMIMLKSLTDVRNAYCTIGKYIKNLFPMPTIAITGSIGKTTATRFLENIFAEKYNVFSSGNNRNTVDWFTNQLIYRYGPKHTFHVQECGAGEPGLVERAANVLSVDAFCITNILPQHLDAYKTIENLLYDKTSFDRVEGKNCFGVINLDDETLRNHKFNNRIVTYGIKNTEADYVAKNVRQNGLYLEMDITYGDDHTVPIKIKIPGAHNAYGAVMAFAMAKELGLTDEEIQNGFLKYRSEFFRQALREVSGRLMYIDCFSVTEDSIRSCLKTMDDMTVPSGNRKIAVLAGAARLGNDSFSANYSLGLSFTDYHVDEYIIFGLPEPGTAAQYNIFGHSYALYQGIKHAFRGESKVSFYSDPELVAEKLVKVTRPGDVILFKANHRFSFVSLIDRAFGTSFTPNFVHAPHSPVFLQENGFSANYYPDTDTCNLKSGIIANKIFIPDCIKNRRIARIGRAAFAKKINICEIDFGKSCVNIGMESFKCCINIKSLELPRNILHIEADAFADCTSLESVVIKGAEHIEAGAFRNCKNLRTVVLPKTVCTIEKDVFAGCPDITVIAPKNSLAAAYAKNNGLKLIET